MNDDNGITWFEKALKETLGDVKPIKSKDKTKKVYTYQQPNKPKVYKNNNPYLSKNFQNKNPNITKCLDIPELYTGEIEFKFSSECHIEYKHSSISTIIFKNIKNNKFTLDSYLDLHGYNVEAAAKITNNFIKNALLNNYRYIKIITGKGKGKLKNYLIYWLDEIPYILAYCTAPINHGGTGAIIIYLKKS